jgi:hypothetical protein
MRFQRPALLAPIAFALAGIVVLLGCGKQDVSRKSARPHGRDPLAAYRELRGPAEPLPARLRAFLLSARDPEIKGLWMTRAHFIAIRGEGFWVLRGVGVVCIVQERGALSCTNNATFLRKGLILALIAPPIKHSSKPQRRIFAVWGIAPDWASVASLRVGHERHSVRVRRNSYAYRATRPIFLSQLRT